MNSSTDVLRIITPLVEHNIPFTCERGKITIKGHATISVYGKVIDITKEKACPFAVALPQEINPRTIALWMVREYKARG